MKKRLEAELISIAHRVLKLKNKSEIDQLFTETQKLYEALSVLKFYGDYIGQVPQPEVDRETLEAKISDSLEGKAAPKLEAEVQQEVTKEKKQVVPVDEEVQAGEEAQPAQEEKIIVGEIDAEEEEVQEGQAGAEENSDPIFEMAADPNVSEQKEEEEETATTAEPEKEGKTPSKQISFEDFLGDFKEVEFVKPNDLSLPKEEPEEEPEPETPAEKEPEIKEPGPKEPPVKEPREEPARQTQEAKPGSGISIGLNDRVGFVKYLFDNSNEDFNRVLSQLNTFDTYADARQFIDEMVKPDYNDWKGQEDFAERFMEIVEQKFR